MYRMLRYAGLDPGAEFKAAMLEAQALNARSALAMDAHGPQHTELFPGFEHWSRMPT